MFINDKKRLLQMISLFSLSIPIGSGLSYLISSKLYLLFSNWQWSLRITPGLGLTLALLIAIIFKEPVSSSDHNYLSDLKHLFTNKIFIFLTFGYVCTQFSINGLLYWFPIYQLESFLNKRLTNDMPNIFGLITILAGCLAFCFCSFVAFRLKRLINNCFDSLISACCCIITVPIIIISILEANKTYSQLLIWSNTCVILAILYIANIMSCYALMVNSISKHSIVFAFYLLIGVLLADIGSVYSIGALKDYLIYMTNGFDSLQHALYLIPIFSTFGSISYFLVSFHLFTFK